MSPGPSPGGAGRSPEIDFARLRLAARAAGAALAARAGESRPSGRCEARSGGRSEKGPEPIEPVLSEGRRRPCARGPGGASLGELVDLTQDRGEARVGGGVVRGKGAGALEVVARGLRVRG